MTFNEPDRRIALRLPVRINRLVRPIFARESSRPVKLLAVFDVDLGVAMVSGCCVLFDPDGVPRLRLGGKSLRLNRVLYHRILGHVLKALASDRTPVVEITSDTGDGVWREIILAQRGGVEASTLAAGTGGSDTKTCSRVSEDFFSGGDLSPGLADDVRQRGRTEDPSAAAKT